MTERPELSELVPQAIFIEDVAAYVQGRPELSAPCCYFLYFSPYI